MSVVFRAGELPDSERKEYWEHVLGETLGPIEPLDVPDQVLVGSAGAVRVGRLSSSRPGGARRTRQHSRRSSHELYKVDVIARGRGVVEQDGRRARLGPGDLALMDLSRPARWSMSSVECVALMFPPALLPLPAERVAASTAVRIPGDGAGALPSWVARQLAGHLDRPDGARLGTAVLDLLAVALAERFEPGHEPPPETRERALLLNVRAFIEQRLDDPALSPSTIAAAHHVSVRYLHKLFETQQTTVAAWVRQRRLERCRRDLLDPALRAWSVSAIGARWGILNAGHFSRLFRAAYGVSPREYRRLGVS